MHTLRKQNESNKQGNELLLVIVLPNSKMRKIQMCLLLFVIINMNKQSKENIGNFKNKLQLCEDELSSLLDLIYKFPQQQRERYYDRIQLLKQNITQLKLSSPSLTVNLEKKYQQLFIKLNQLKAEISACEILAPSKKRKGVNSDGPSIFSETLQSNKIRQGRQAGKSDYDEIMETVVQKDQELKKYKHEIQQYKNMLKQYEDQQIEMKMFYESLQKQLFEIKNVTQTQSNKAQSLEIKLEEANALNQKLQSACNQYKANAMLAEQQINKLVLLLTQATEDCKLKKIQIESIVIQHAALEEKYRYDLKSHIEKEDAWKMREKNYEKKISQLQKVVETLAGADEKKQELLADNLRLKEDIKVLETELTSKEEHVYEKNKKIETYRTQIQGYRTQIQDLKARNSQSQDKIDKSQQQLHLALILKEQNENIMNLQQKKIRQLENFVAEQEQKKMICDKKIRNLEQEISELRGEIQKFKQEIKKSQNNQHKKDQELTRLCQEKQMLEKELQRNRLDLARVGKKLEETANILGKVEQEKLKIQGINELVEKDAKTQEQRCKKLQKQIENLKKRLIRAKIQAIHNLRQIIV